MVDIIDPFGGIYPTDDTTKRKTIDVRGRKEHEAFIKDADKCKAHGIDQVCQSPLPKGRGLS